jgi:GAF domain-containing protein
VRAPDHPFEEQRIQALHDLEILDTDGEAMWDQLTALVSNLCQTPIALMSLVDEDRQWFKSHLGLDAQETPRDMSFCGFAILQKDVLVVPDATQDERFFDNGLVTGDPLIRAYAGAPVVAPNGMPVGTLCAIDRVPRELTDTQIEGLVMLADMANALLRQRQQANLLRRVFSDEHIAENARAIVRDVSDEFLNPLTPIVIQIARLRQMGADEHALDVIERNVLRIRETVRDACKVFTAE